MTHRIVKLAQTVMDNADLYSEVVVTRAMYILQWNKNRRKAILKLWKNYHSVYQKFIVIKKRRFNRYTEADKILYNNLDKSLHNDFHICYNALKNRKDVVLTFIIFENSVKASNCTNIKGMHEYMSCVNAARFNDTLSDIVFLRAIPKEELSEILLFRLLNS